MRAFHRWLRPYLCGKTRSSIDNLRVFLAIADHFEPFHRTNHLGAMERMLHWRREYPASVASFRDNNGRSPRHTFFYPIEQYDRKIVGELAALCRETGSETEVHLHHDGDSEDSLRSKLMMGVSQLRTHDMLSQYPDGRPAFGFVHGDWALANSLPDGECCGVAHELAVLRECGCYADFTFPSAPSSTQPARVNSIHYAKDTGSPATLANGEPLRAGVIPPEASSLTDLLLVQGVLALNWSWRKWGFLPRVDNSDITQANPPTPERFELWLRHAPSPQGLENWVFIKIHTHGAVPRNSGVILGESMRKFHRFLCEDWAGAGRGHLHYVTAREMVNILHAIEAGEREFRTELLNYSLPPPELFTREASPASSE